MRFGAVATMTLFVAVGFVAFTPACNLIETRPGAGSATGGNSDPPSSSGGSASGGSKSSGGSGGSSAKGGSGGSGGFGVLAGTGQDRWCRRARRHIEFV